MGEEAEREMIRVVNLVLDGRLFLRGVRGNCGRRRRILSSLLVVSGGTGGYDDLGERVRCVFMGVRDLEPSRIRRGRKYDLSEDSISAFRLL